MCTEIYYCLCVCEKQKQTHHFEFVEYKSLLSFVFVWHSEALKISYFQQTIQDCVLSHKFCIFILFHV